MMNLLNKEIEVYPVGESKCPLKRIKFNFPIYKNGKDEISTLIKNFNSMTEQLKNNQYLNKDFVNNVSHEFKTPISAIMGDAELINNKSENQEIKKYSGIIEGESQRLAETSERILMLSKIDNQTIISKDDYFNPSEQIRNILQTTQCLWEEKILNLNLNWKISRFKIVNILCFIYGKI